MDGLKLLHDLHMLGHGQAMADGIQYFQVQGYGMHYGKNNIGHN